MICISWGSLRNYNSSDNLSQPILLEAVKSLKVVMFVFIKPCRNINKEDLILCVKIEKYKTFIEAQCSNGIHCILSRIFQRKILANKMALVGMAGGRAASTIRLKFWLKFCFLTITQMFLNGID